jgi:predicted heme/steroid binding protein
VIKLKKVIVIILSFMLLSSSVLFVGCSKGTTDSTSTSTAITSTPAVSTDAPADVTSTPAEVTIAPTDSSSTKVFTIDELKTFDGQNGNSAYVAVDGIVYDVTNADKWNNGKHENGIVAGVDLTSVLGDSPHGDKVLKDLPVVGTLE